jgi:hypothetical protein
VHRLERSATDLVVVGIVVVGWSLRPATYAPCRQSDPLWPQLARKGGPNPWGHAGNGLGGLRNHPEAPERLPPSPLDPRGPPFAPLRNGTTGTEVVRSDGADDTSLLGGHGTDET